MADDGALPGADFDDVVESLRKLVDLATVGNALTVGTHALLVGKALPHVPPAGGAAPIPAEAAARAASDPADAAPPLPAASDFGKLLDKIHEALDFGKIVDAGVAAALDKEAPSPPTGRSADPDGPDTEGADSKSTGMSRLVELATVAVHIQDATYHAIVDGFERKISSGKPGPASPAPAPAPAPASKEDDDYVSGPMRKGGNTAKKLISSPFRFMAEAIKSGKSRGLAFGKFARGVAKRASPGGKLPAGAGKKFLEGGAALGEVAGAATGVVGGLALVAVGLKAGHNAVVSFTDAALRSAERLKEVSGEMAAVFAEKEMNDLVRGQKVGAETAGTTGTLAAAEANRKDSSMKIESQVTNLMNNFWAGANDLMSPFLRGLGELQEVVPIVGHIWKKLSSSGEVGPGGFGGEAEMFKAEAVKLELYARDMMAAVRRGTARAAVGGREEGWLKARAD